MKPLEEQQMCQRLRDAVLARDDDPAVAEHLAGCPQCAAVAGEAADIDALLGDLPLVPAPDGVVERLHRVARPRPWRDWTLRLWPSALAAVAAVALMLAVRGNHTEESPAVQRAAAEAVAALGLVCAALDHVEQRAVVDVVDQRLPAAVNDVLGSWPDQRRFEQ